MRSWYKYIISKDKNIDVQDRFVFTNYQLIENNKNFKDIFNFENFKKNPIFFKQYEFLKKNLDPNKETLFIGSSWGEMEFFLKNKFKILASDNEDKYIKFHKENTDLNFIKLDILNISSHDLKYKQIVVNNIEYLFDVEQMKKCIENISKISESGAEIFVIFRSRDGFLIKIIDQILTLIETYLIYLLKRINKEVYFFRAHHGFRRSLEEFKKNWIESNFEYKKIYEDLFGLDFNKLRIIQKLKITNFLRNVFLKSNPHLNILVFKKN